MNVLNFKVVVRHTWKGDDWNIQWSKILTNIFNERLVWISIFVNCALFIDVLELSHCSLR